MKVFIGGRCGNYAGGQLITTPVPKWLALAIHFNSATVIRIGFKSFKESKEIAAGGIFRQGMSLMLLSANTEYHNLIGNTALTTAAQVEQSKQMIKPSLSSMCMEVDSDESRHFHVKQSVL